jgi:hypothetical protein
MVQPLHLQATGLMVEQLFLVHQRLSSRKMTAESSVFNTFGLVSNSEHDRRTRLWTIKLSKPISQF